MNSRRAQWSAAILVALVFAAVGAFLFQGGSAGRFDSKALRVSRAREPMSIRAAVTTPGIPRRAPALGARVRQRLADWKAESDPLRRQAIQEELLQLLTAANAGEIVRALSPDLLDAPFGEIALTRWSAADRRAAADWMAGLPAATEYQAGLVVYGWMKEDRAGLHGYLETLPDDSVWKQSILKVATNDALLLQDGVEAIGLLLHLPSKPQRDEMLGWAATEWAMQEPERAAEWTQQISDPVLQSKLFGAAVVGYAWKNPQRAADLLVNAFGTAPVETTALTSVMNIWSREDPGAAARWAVQTLSDGGRELALCSALTAWGYKDFAAAKAWAKNLSAGPVRTQADLTLNKVEAALRGVELSDEPPRGGG